MKIENSDLNQIDGHWFEVDTSMGLQGSEVQKFEQSSCDVVQVAKVVVELPQSSDGGGRLEDVMKPELQYSINIGECGRLKM